MPRDPRRQVSQDGIDCARQYCHVYPAIGQEANCALQPAWARGFFSCRALFMSRTQRGVSRESDMQGVDQLLRAGGLDVETLAARFGLGPVQARSAMGALLPAVAGGFQRLGPAAGTVAESQGVAGASDADTAIGNAVLGQIFGSKEVSRQVADHAAGQSGVSNTILKAMLPIVATEVAKHVAGDGNVPPGAAGDLGGLLGLVFGGGDAGGNPLDDILSGFGRR